MKGLSAKGNTFVIGVWGYYEEQYYNNKIFVTPDAAIGENLLKPINDMYQVGLENNMEFVSLDLISEPEQVEAYIFFDFPRLQSRYVKEAFAADKPKFLMILESPLIKEDNWDPENLAIFTKIFTYRDDLDDKEKFIKINYSFDLPSTINKNLALKEKLCAAIAGSKMLAREHELSLYPARVDAIRWFEKNHPEDFDLFGMGWDRDSFPSYRGMVKSKKQTLKKYKFSICYENTKDIPGYITEKIFDCFFAGCVPVYWGANNVTDYIPESCFIDRRKFESYEALYDFLKNMSDEDYSKYLDAIETFLNSDGAAKFTSAHFAETVIRECLAVVSRSFAKEIVLSKKGETMPALRSRIESCGAAIPGERDKHKGLASIMVMAFGKLDYTRQCVESILRVTEKPYELVLIDNGSTDGTFEYFESVKKRNPDIVVIRNRLNRIVEENANYAVSMARGEYIVAVTNDTLVHEGWLDNFIRQIEAAPDIGVVGPRSNNISGPQMVKTDYRTADEYQEFAARWCRQNAGTAFEMSRMVGMAFIIRKATIERIGGFDPALPTNGRDGGYGFSDDDMSLRLLLAGYRILVANDVFIHHFGSVTARQYRPDLFGPYQNINQEKYIDKLRNNPRITMLNNGEIRLHPYRLDESIPVPEPQRIRFPRVLVVVMDDASADGQRYHGLLQWYPVAIRVISKEDVIGLMKAAAACGEYDLLVTADNRLDVGAPALKQLIDAALCNPDVAIMVPAADYAPSTHSIQHAGREGIDLIPYADMSVSAVKMKIIRACVKCLNDHDDVDDALWFLQRRVRGEGYFIARVNEIAVKSGCAAASHPYDSCRLPEVLIEHSDFRGAAEIYRHDIRRDAFFFESICQLGRISLNEGRINDAVICFNRVLELDPNHVPSLLELAGILLRHGDLRQAKRLVNMAYIRQPWNQEVKDIVEEYEKRAGRPASEASFKRPAKKGLVSIIIAGSNNTDEIEKSLRSLSVSGAVPHEILIVGTGLNGSGLKRLERLAGKIPQARIVWRGEDRAFAGACNLGISEARGEYILLLDSTVSLGKGAPENLLECLNSTESGGVVGPIIMSGEKALLRGEYSHRRIPARKVKVPCILFRSELVNTIGILDENIASAKFAVEDYCLRAEMEGFVNLIDGDVFAGYGGEPPSVTAASKRVYREKWAAADIKSDTGRKLLAVKALEKSDDFYQKGDIEKAVQVLIEGMQYAPDDTRLYYALCEMLIDAKRFQDALDTLERAPSDAAEARRQTLFGYCRDGLGNEDEASACADRALSERGSWAPALNLKGIIQYKKGDKDGAAAFFKMAAESDPGYGEPHTNLGVIRWADGDRKAALDLLETGFILSPGAADNSELYYSVATQEGNLERTEDVLRNAMECYPLNRRITFLLIDCLLRRGKPDAAMYEIERAMITFGIDEGMLSAALAVRGGLGAKEIDRSKTGATVSLCMIVKNEAEHLPKCLMSALPVVDEIIVVDTGSADRTADIARAFGARVFDFAWTSDFSEARNISLSRASGDWILVLDADEVISPRDYEALKKLVRRKGISEAYSFTTRNYVDRANVEGWNMNDGLYEIEEAGTGWLPSFKVRLFPNDADIRFENPVHELVEPSLRKKGITIAACAVPIHHYGKMSDEKSLMKGEAYYQLGRKKLEEKGDDFLSLLELALQAAELEKYDEAVDLWLRLLKIRPDFAKAYFNLGYDYLKLGRYEDGIETSLKALELDPSLKEAVLNYSSCELYGGSIEKGIRALEEMLRKYPDHPSATLLLGIAYLAVKKAEKGIEYMERIKKMNVDCAGVIFNHAKEFERAGRKEQEIRLLEAAVGNGYVNNDIFALLAELKKQ